MKNLDTLCRKEINSKTKFQLNIYYIIIQKLCFQMNGKINDCHKQPLAHIQ